MRTSICDTSVARVMLKAIDRAAEIGDLIDAFIDAEEADAKTARGYLLDEMKAAAAELRGLAHAVHSAAQGVADD